MSNSLSFFIKLLKIIDFFLLINSLLFFVHICPFLVPLVHLGANVETGSKSCNLYFLWVNPGAPAVFGEEKLFFL